MILEKIRSRTNYVHRRLEENSILSKLTQNSFSLPEYISVLSRFYGFISPVEDKIYAIAGLENYVPDLDQRKKKPLLISDISKLSAGSLSNLSFCTNLPEINSVADAFGYLYVMEGSTLGGKIISESIRTTLNLSPENGVSYFFSYGQGRGVMWKSFINYLTSYALIAASEEEEIINSAENTFIKLESWLNQQ